MAGIVFSTESWHPAAERISECFAYFDARMKVIDLSKYCDALDTIGIIPFSGPNKHTCLAANGHKYWFFTKYVER